MKNQVQVALQTQNQVRTTSTELFEATVNTETYHQVLCLKLKQAGKANVLKAIKQLEQRDDVVYVGPDYAISLIDAVPNDPEYSTQQWAPQKIGLPQAWEYNTTGVTVGILDTGIDATHPDLANRLSTTKNRDFTSGVELLVNAPTDPNGHGTHVAGIIGARGNNGIGISGVCWNTTLVSLRVLDASCNGYSSHVALAIMSAQQQNIPILNFSGGWSQNNSQYDYALGSILANYYGLFICSAGNDRINCDYDAIYPASFQIPNVIAVGASEQNNTPWIDDFVVEKGTNYGRRTVDIFAPGDYIISTYPGGEYAFFSGTSMAAAYVTGVAALMMAENPLLSPAAIKQILIRTANKVTDDNGNQIFGNLCVSRGLLDAYSALSACHLHTSDNIETEPDWHTVGSCDHCDTSDIEQPHSFIPYASKNETKHWVVCACGYISEENHVFDYSVLSAQ